MYNNLKVKLMMSKYHDDSDKSNVEHSLSANSLLGWTIELLGLHSTEDFVKLSIT